MSTFDIDPDIRRAQTLPARFYTDAATHARVLERVFAPSWQFVGDDDMVRENGAVAPFTLLEGALDEALMLVRDDHGALRCLSNVCTHRANLVATERCTLRSLVCGYHGRRFELDGRFRSCPEFDSAENFPAASDDLPELPLAHFGNLHFASIAAEESFEAQFGDLATRLAWLPHDELVLDATRSRDFEFDAHWALYCDNYLEGFHIPFVHPTLNDAIDFGTYTTELFERSSLQIGLAKPGEVAFEPPIASRDHGKRIAGYYAWLWPNLMLNYYPWGLSLNLVEPRGLARTRVRFREYVWDESKRDRGAGRGLDAVEMEDECVVLRAQAGVKSRLYDRGRYSPTREQGVHHFHRLLADALTI